MAVVIAEEEAWEPKPRAYLLLFASCFASLFLLPNFFRPPGTTSRAAASSFPFDLGPTAPFQRFQRRFLLLFSLASVMEGLGSMAGEYDYAQYGLSREQMALSLSIGAAVALFVGSFLGIVSDIIGSRKCCILFCVLHLFVGVLKSVSRHPSLSVISICLALGTSAFSFCFEAWMVIEHEKQGYRKDLLNDTFWLMCFFEAASLITSQGFTNLLVGNHHKTSLSPSASAALLAILSILYIRKEWNGCPESTTFGNYTKSFSGHIINDKRIWILVLAQASVSFSTSVFWFLWAPTIVADGRQVHLSLIYPCFLGSRMLGSTVFPWFFGMSSSPHNGDPLIIAFVVAGVAFSIVAYDYQDIGVLVTLFCIFQACVGFILPSLARLRTLYVPNELRGGMISLSLAPANAAFLFVLIQGGYHRNFGNAVIMALAALVLLTSAGCIHVLRWWRKHPHHNWHAL